MAYIFIFHFNLPLQTESFPQRVGGCASCQFIASQLQINFPLPFLVTLELGPVSTAPLPAGWMLIEGAGIPLWPAEQEEGISLPFPSLAPARREEEPCQCSPAWTSSTSLHPPASFPVTQSPFLCTRSGLQPLANFSTTWQADPTDHFWPTPSCACLCHKQAESYPCGGQVLGLFLLLSGCATSELLKVLFSPFL